MVTINFKVYGRYPVIVFTFDGTDFQILNAHIEIQEKCVADNSNLHIGVFQYLLWYIQDLRCIADID